MKIIKFYSRLFFSTLLILGCEKNNLITTPKEDSVISKDDVTVKPPDVVDNSNNEEPTNVVIEKDGVYYIYSLDDLYWIASEANKNRNNFSGKTVRLMNDIDMKNKPFSGIATGGKDNNPYYSFEGTFDGNGKKIKGLNIEDTSGYYIGFIGYLGKGTVKNLEIESGSVKGRAYIGAIAGRSEGIIERCNNNANIEGGYYIGGIAGYNYGTITGSGNKAKVAGVKGSSEYIGGIAGANNKIVEGVYNTGNIYGGAHIGGITGANYEAVIRSYNTGSVNGDNLIGGISGRNIAGISNSYNTGNVNAIGSPGIAGGISGIHIIKEGSVTPLIRNSYNIGNVTTKNDSIIGGIVGYRINGNVSSSYYLQGSANFGIGEPEGNRGATPISSSDFSKNSVIIWGSSGTWKFKSGLGGSVDTRPVLIGVGEEGK